MQLLRNLGRRKVRTALTILGITIGIWALVVFGSMANKINALVAGGSDYFRDKVAVSAKGGTMGLGGPLAISTADQVARLPGVDVVVTGVALPLSDDASTMSMGTPPVITTAQEGRDGGRETFVVHYAAGRAISAADEGSNVTVLGSDLARQYQKAVGDTMTLWGDTFTVVGILEPTLTAPDGSASIPLAAAQRLYVRTLPPLVAAKLTPSEIATGLTVYPTPGTSPETVATEIKAALTDVSVMTGKDFDKQIGGATSILNSILVGIALISLVVGGLSVINTMAMSIAERTREIGIKRAIGGQPGTHRPRVRDRVRPDRLHRRRGRPRARRGCRLRRERRRTCLRHDPVRPHDGHGADGSGVLHDPRRPGRPHPSPQRSASRPRRGAALRMTHPRQTGDT